MQTSLRRLQGNVFMTDTSGQEQRYERCDKNETEQNNSSAPKHCLPLLTLKPMKGEVDELQANTRYAYEHNAACPLSLEPVAGRLGQTLA